MRRFTLVLSPLFLLGLYASARPRSERDAHALAQRYFDHGAAQILPLASLARMQPIRLAYAAWRGVGDGRERMMGEANAYYYIFCRGEGAGFAIVPGDAPTVSTSGMRIAECSMRLRCHLLCGPI